MVPDQGIPEYVAVYLAAVLTQKSVTIKQSGAEAIPDLYHSRRKVATLDLYLSMSAKIKLYQLDNIPWTGAHPCVRQPVLLTTGTSSYSFRTPYFYSSLHLLHLLLCAIRKACPEGLLKGLIVVTLMPSLFPAAIHEVPRLRLPSPRHRTNRFQTIVRLPVTIAGSIDPRIEYHPISTSTRVIKHPILHSIDLRDLLSGDVVDRNAPEVRPKRCEVFDQCAKPLSKESLELEPEESILIDRL